MLVQTTSGLVGYYNLREGNLSRVASKSTSHYNKVFTLVASFALARVTEVRVQLKMDWSPWVRNSNVRRHKIVLLYPFPILKAFINQFFNVCGSDYGVHECTCYTVRTGEGGEGRRLTKQQT